MQDNYKIHASFVLVCVSFHTCQCGPEPLAGLISTFAEVPSKAGPKSEAIAVRLRCRWAQRHDPSHA